MKKKNIIIIISAIIVVVTLIVATVVINQNKTVNGYNKNSSIKQILEYYKCQYFKTTISSENSYSKDIYLSFASDPINIYGNTRQQEYEQVISAVAIKMNSKNYRMIDEGRNLIVRVTFNEKGNIEYTINNQINYFTQKAQEYSIQNTKSVENVDISVKSNEIQSLINNDWSRKKASLGTVDSTCDDYDYYFDEGYKVRVINTKVYNIIFTKQYNSEVFDKITTKMNNNDIKNILGNPTYEENGVIGYKNNNFYTFFYEGEISVYMPDQFNDQSNEKFEKIVTNYVENKNYNDFINSLTTIYSDYETYTQNDNYVRISYPQRGFEVVFGLKSNNGIYLYDNYKGLVVNNRTYDDLIKNGNIPNGIFLKSNMNLIDQKEYTRCLGETERMLPSTSGLNNPHVIESYSNKFSAVYSSSENKISFYSLDKNHYDSEINNISNFTEVYNLSDFEFVFGIKNDGIYYYNAVTKNKVKIISNDGNNEIVKVENNTIYYDQTNISVER